MAKTAKRSKSKRSSTKAPLAETPPVIETFRRLVTISSEDTPIVRTLEDGTFTIVTGKTVKKRVDTFDGVRVPGYAEKTMATIATEVIVTSANQTFLGKVRRAESRMEPLDPEGSTSMSFDVRTYFDARGKKIPSKDVPADAMVHSHSAISDFEAAALELSKVPGAKGQQPQSASSAPMRPRRT